jgi:hypothetical protein
MNLLEPTNHRISNSLFDAINKVRNGETVETQQLDEATMLQDNGKMGEATNLSHQAKTTMKHIPNASPALKKAAKDIKPGIAGYRDRVDMLKAGGVKEGNDGNLANNAPPYDKVTRGDVIAGRLGKDQMGGKKKDAKSMKEDVASGQKSPPVSPKEMKPKSKDHNSNDSKRASTMKKDASVTNSGKPRNEETEIEEARSTGTAFDMSTPSQIKKKPGELTGHSMKKSEAGGRIYTKTAPKMPQDFGVPHNPKKKAMKEGISQTVINHNDFVLEVTDNPTYGDYLKALQSMINNNDEQIQQELITIAQEAYKQNINAIIIEASARATFRAKLQELRTSGAKVLDENYIVESGEPYVEYVVEQDGVRKQYVHSGTVKKV